MQVLPALLLSATLALPLATLSEAGEAEPVAAPPAAEVAGSSPPRDIAGFTATMERREGFIPFYIDRRHGKLYLQLDAFEREMIYLHSLPEGVGSNDLGFDRGQLMEVLPALVRFEHVGDKVLLRRLNTRYRADSDNPLERRAVEEAFASSVLWGFPVVARGEAAVLVDATDFLLRDSHGIGRKLAEMEQGEYQVDASRSALYFPRTRGFPRNTELEASVTLTGKKPGEYLRQVAPDPWSFSVRMHHSFIALPEPGYRPREFHPESGYWPFSYADYATPIQADLVRRFVPRHRLVKRNPGPAPSEPVKPIIYYLDPGTPEPVRSALLEGARWWNRAFEAAGFRNAFQVQMLPADADPMDVRYNVIQWVHRATRGWSYGYGVHDPRTGEIIKGHVTLGSLRVRQDYLIAQGMTSPFVDPDSDASALTEMALARIRQLSAHEVGHTLGLAHNFAASPMNRASVMDYPHPLIRLDPQGELVLNDAYAEGIGAWDKRAIGYGYADFGDPAGEAAALDEFVAESRAQGHRFVADPDARSLADLHATGSLWDNGADAVAELHRVAEVRAAALARFGEHSIAPGRTWSSLEEVLVPVYYYHRYQVEAAGKWLGGSDYRYALRRPGETYRFTPMAAPEQRRALDALLSTLEPRFLHLPLALRQQIPPKAYGYERSRESAAGYTGAQLDPVSLAEASIQHTLDVLLAPARLARMELQFADDPSMPAVDEMFQRLFERLLVPAELTGLDAAIQQRGGAALLANWRRLAASAEVAPEVRARAWAALDEAAAWLRRNPRGGDPDFFRFQLWLIERFQARPPALEDLPRREMPPGSPIGAG